MYLKAPITSVLVLVCFDGIFPDFPSQLVSKKLPLQCSEMAYFFMGQPNIQRQGFLQIETFSLRVGALVLDIFEAEL